MWQTTKNRSTPAALSDSASHRAAGIEEELLQHQGRAVALPWQEYDRSSRVHVEITSKTWISCNQIIAKQD